MGEEIKDQNSFLKDMNHQFDHKYDSIYDVRGSRAKPCRACNAFQSWAKLQTKPINKPHFDSQCPLDKDQLGRNTWAVIHTMAAYYPQKPTVNQQKDMEQFIRIFSRFYPCEPCAQDLRKDIELDPPQTQSQKSLSQWWCRIHNKVNKKLGKKLFDCSRVDERWLNGWSDGSCD